MNKVINFNQARKKVLKRKKEQTSSENRAKFGRTKSDKSRTEQEKKSQIDHVDDHKLDPSDELDKS